MSYYIIIELTTVSGKLFANVQRCAGTLSRTALARTRTSPGHAHPDWCVPHALVQANHRAASTAIAAEEMEAAVAAKRISSATVRLEL